jgi:ATP-dependent Clp protease adaptor protein ClpS
MSFSAPTPLKETSEQDKAELTPLWHVVLLDDNDHTYDYVIEMLVRLFGTRWRWTPPGGRSS